VHGRHAWTVTSGEYTATLAGGPLSFGFPLLPSCRGEWVEPARNSALPKLAVNQPLQRQYNTGRGGFEQADDGVVELSSTYLVFATTGRDPCPDGS